MQEDFDDVQREVEILQLVSDNEHVAELYDTFEDDKAVHMVLELCKGGELFDRIISKGTFTERMAAGTLILRIPAALFFAQCHTYALFLPA